MKKYLYVSMRLEGGQCADVYYDLREGTLDEMTDKAIKGIVDLKGFMKDGQFREGVLPAGSPEIKVGIRAEAA